jgi:hypothetical protein
LAPIQGYEVESCLIAELYWKRLAKFTFWNAKANGTVNINFSIAEAFAINNILGDYDNAYQTFIQMLVEPQLPEPKEEQ